MSCKDCAWWKRPDSGAFKGSPYGECHGRAPQPRTRQTADNDDDPILLVDWPLTEEDDFCGDFRHRFADL